MLDKFEAHLISAFESHPKMIEKVLSPLMTLGSESLRRTASASRNTDTRIQMIYSVDTVRHTKGTWPRTMTVR